MTGTRVTCTDLSSGDSETVTIVDDYVLICDGDRYLSDVQHAANTGTVVLTIRKRVPDNEVAP